MNSSNFAGIDLFQLAFYIGFYLLGHLRGRKAERASQPKPPADSNTPWTVPPGHVLEWTERYRGRPQLFFCHELADDTYGWAGYGKDGGGFKTQGAAVVDAFKQTGMTS